jgi:hypothetical protein
MALTGALSAVLAVIVIAVATRDRRPAVLVSAAIAAFLIPLVWHTILRLTGATQMVYKELPLPILPISWQDMGNAMFTLAGASLLFALLTSRVDPPPRIAVLAIWTALAALVVDIYLD